MRWVLSVKIPRWISVGTAPTASIVEPLSGEVFSQGRIFCLRAPSRMQKIR